MLPTILCDRREPVERVALLQQAGLHTWHSPETGEPELEFGDYSWRTKHGLTVGVEVKVVKEALARFGQSSGKHQRSLQDQLKGLHDTYDIPIFLYGGRLQRTPEGHCRVYGFDTLLSYDGYLNWLNQSLPQDLPQMRVEHIEDDRNLMLRLHSLIKYYERATHKATWTVSERRPLFTVDAAEEEAIAAIMNYPTMGEELAKRILEAGNSPYSLFKDIMENAGEESLEIDGIGPKRTKELRRVLSYRKKERR